MFEHGGIEWPMPRLGFDEDADGVHVREVERG